jgi:hypothetical protein
MLRKTLFSFIFCYFVFGAFAQEQALPSVSQPFNEEVWKKVVQDIDYADKHRDEIAKPDYKPKKDNAQNRPYQDKTPRKQGEQQTKPRHIDDYYTPPEESKRKESKPRDSSSDFDSPSFFSGGDTFLKALAIIGGIVLLGFLIYFFMGGINQSDKALEIEELKNSLQEIEENLPMADVETPLQKAIRLGEYKVAMRMYFLLILQKLATQNLIKWRKDKTNREYSRELRNAAFLPKFMEATLAYERAWFGEKELNKEEFEEKQLIFEELKRILSN